MMLITIRRNTVTGRFHPFLWRPAPLPGPGSDPVLRYKSKLHHTAGFETLEDAQAFARGELAKVVTEHYGAPLVEVDAAEDDAWQEGEVPASVLLRPTSAT